MNINTGSLPRLDHLASPEADALLVDLLGNMHQKLPTCVDMVHRDIDQLATWLSKAGHNWATTRCSGQELEFVVIDQKTLRPTSASLVLLPELEARFGSVFGSELLQSNVEMSTAPLRLEAGGLTQSERQISEAWRDASALAAKSGNLLFAGGMMPLYRLEDFADTTMLYPERYEAMNKILMSRIGGSFTLAFTRDGKQVQFNNFSVEGVPTSHQVHLSATPADLVTLYNASLAVMGPLIAVSANSPFFCGMTGWHESRVPLLEQGAAGDRFIFSSGFATAPADLFTDLKNFAPLTSIEDGQEQLLGKKKDDGCDPLHLPAFQAQNGTVWKWLRPCYSCNGGDAPHVRLEQRILPAGPTPIDMAANAAFLLGTLHGLVETKVDITQQFRFADVKSNFYDGAEHGLDALMKWSHGREMTAKEIVAELLPVARIGLEKMNATPEEIDTYLDVIRQRNESGQTGSVWMLKSVDSLEQAGASREVALQTATREMVNWQQKNLKGEIAPVHTWPVL